MKYSLFSCDHSGSFQVGTATATSSDAAMTGLGSRALDQIDAVGHRIVHGGPRHTAHCLFRPSHIEDLTAAGTFAPLHARGAIACLIHLRERLPGIPHVLCFDHAFHSTLPESTSILPIPKPLRDRGLRKYGFHGLVCESVIHQLGCKAPEKIVVAHLGGGSSVTAIRSLASFDTTMGLGPTGGVVMGTRSGDLDPSVIIHLLRNEGVTVDALERLLNRSSGLAAISADGGNMRRLMDQAECSREAALAIEIFCCSISKAIAGSIAAMGGVDLIVFTGGVGENAPSVRSRICDRLSWFGIRIDNTLNARSGRIISNAESRCEVQILAANENERIAFHTWTLSRTSTQ